MTIDPVGRLRAAIFVTGNPGKLAEAERLCGVEIQAADIDLPEIQSLDIEEVLRAKATEAFQRLRQPVVVDETALELAAFNGFPGVLIKWMLQSLGAEGLARSARDLGDPRASAKCGLLYRSEDRELFAQGVTNGQLVVPPRGEGGFGWDSVFQPDGHDLTYAELSGPAKDSISHRGLAWRNLKARLGHL